MSKKIIISFLFLAVVAGIIFLMFFSKNNKQSSGTTKQEDKKEIVLQPQKLKFLINPEVDNFNWLVNFTRDKKYFERHNLDIEFLPTTRGLGSTLAAEGGDVAFIDIPSSLVPYMNGADTRLLATTYNLFNTFAVSRFPKDKAKTSVKKAATAILTGEPKIMAALALKTLGVDPSKSEIISVPTNEVRKELLEKGEIDLALINGNFISSFQLNNKYYILPPEEFLSGASLIRGIAATKKSITEKPQAIKDFVLAFYESLQYMTAHSQEVQDYLREHRADNNYPDQDIEKIYNSFLIATQGVNYVPTMEVVGQAADLVKQNIDVKSDRDLKDYIYADFAQAAVNQGVK